MKWLMRRVVTGDDDFGFVVLIRGVGRVGAVIREDAVPSFNVSWART